MKAATGILADANDLPCEIGHVSWLGERSSTWGAEDCADVLKGMAAEMSKLDAPAPNRNFQCGNSASARRFVGLVRQRNQTPPIYGRDGHDSVDSSF